MHPIKNSIICAIDTADIAHATHLCKTLAPHIGMAKFGLEFFMAHGPEGIRTLQKVELPIFLDVKLHDIPNTVSKAITSLIPLHVGIITLHCSGGSDMLRMASDTARSEASKHGIPAPKLIGITVLTSLSEQDLKRIGVPSSPEEHVTQLAALGQASGLDGIVCSPHEIEAVRKTCGHDFTIITPGIRLPSDAINDQKRTLTPQEALKKGANYLVIGRPITGSANPAETAKRFLS